MFEIGMVVSKWNNGAFAYLLILIQTIQNARFYQ